MNFLPIVLINSYQPRDITQNHVGVYFCCLVGCLKYVHLSLSEILIHLKEWSKVEEELGLIRA